MATNVQRRLAEQEQERIREESGKRSAWAFVWTLFVFKIVTVAIIWYAATHTGGNATGLIMATTWYWLLIPIVAISGPLLFRWRLIQWRRRRKQLRAAEWMDREPDDDSDNAAPKLTIQHVIHEQNRNNA